MSAGCALVPQTLVLGIELEAKKLASGRVNNQINTTFSRTSPKNL
jgi:hypothetical protein